MSNRSDTTLCHHAALEAGNFEKLQSSSSLSPHTPSLFETESMYLECLLEYFLKCKYITVYVGIKTGSGSSNQQLCRASVFTKREEDMKWNVEGNNFTKFIACHDCEEKKILHSKSF
ncbi:hypothetical protein ONE63_011528 [Megalurothrips usitatus]|uniref:Uncharacterized protein n=1 Tax=Megalurothrips usitatus TaxID=439358 RepID=A0AAV7X358_9NEOP|nr:hypothetical protein ONE63_011528 [Megalurothrips usitatus]